MWFKNRRAKCRQGQKGGKKSESDKHLSPSTENYSGSTSSPGSQQSGSPAPYTDHYSGYMKSYAEHVPVAPGMPYINGMSPHSWVGYPPTSPSEHAVAPYNGAVNRMPQHTYTTSPTISGNGYYNNHAVPYGMGYPSGNMVTPVQTHYGSNQSGEMSTPVVGHSDNGNLSQTSPNNHGNIVIKDLSQESPVKIEPVYSSQGDSTTEQWSNGCHANSIPSSYQYGVETSPDAHRVHSYKEFKSQDALPKLEAL